MTIKELIKYLKKLKDEDYTIIIDSRPEITRLENIDGTGTDQIKNVIDITLIDKNITYRHFRPGEKIEYYDD